jgi:putative salt-induced outer membrane protein
VKWKNIGFSIFVSLTFVVSHGFAHDPEELPPRTCHGTAEFSFVSLTGNTDTQTMGIGGSVECKPGLWTYLAKGAFVRSETDDVESAKTIDTLFRASRDLSERLKAYGQFIYFQNRFAGIDNRYAIEGGLSYLLINTEMHILQLDGGFGYINEDRVPVPGVLDEDLSFPTARIGESYKWKFSKNAELGDDAGFTFNLSDGSDWRFANLAYVAAELTSILSLKVSHVITYLNEPVPGFGKTDTLTSAAIVAKW